MVAAEPGIASRAEFEAALRALSSADLIKLKRIAQMRVAGLDRLEWSDLLQEAIARALSGSRAWPKDIELVAFLAQTMRSLANEAWCGAERAGVVETDLEHVQDTAPDPEREIAAADTVRHIYSLFQGDPDATAILEGLAAGAGPADIQRAAGMTEHRYAAAQKRIRRKLAREPLQRN